MTSERNVPDDITVSSQVFDIAWHPLADYIAVGQVNGDVDIYHVNSNVNGDGNGEDNSHVLEIRKHKVSCRGLLFSDDGQALYSISSDKSIYAVDASGQKLFHTKKAHDDAINKIISLKESHIFATGDDSGVVKVWDARAGMKEMMSWKLHEDYIAGFAYDLDSRTLLSVAGDACLGVYDLRNQSNNFKSDEQESELCCVEYMKHNRKIICGTQDGVMLIFSTGRFGDCNDRFLGHHESVDCILKIDENTLLTGSSDGVVRYMSMQPNRILGVVGDHEEFPVEGLRCNYQRNLLASYSHDEIVRFYDLSVLGEEFKTDEIDYTAAETDTVNAATTASSSDHMEDGDEEMKDEESSDEDDDNMDDSDGSESEDSDEDSDDSDQESNTKKTLPTAAQKFFADL